MRLLANRSGIALVWGNCVVSLGWLVWGVDCSPTKYCLIHLNTLKAFYKWEVR